MPPSWDSQVQELLSALRAGETWRFQDLLDLCTAFGHHYFRRASASRPNRLDMESAAAEAIERLFLAEDFEEVRVAELVSRLRSHLNTSFWRLGHPKTSVAAERPLKFELGSGAPPILEVKELREVAQRLLDLLLSGVKAIQHDRYHNLLVEEYGLAEFGIPLRGSLLEEKSPEARRTALHRARDALLRALQDILAERTQQLEGSSTTQIAAKLLEKEDEPHKVLQRLLEI